MQTITELNYTQSIWGFQPRKSKILRRDEFRKLLAGRNFVRIDEDDFKQKCRITPLTRREFICPKCGHKGCRHYPQSERYVQGLPDGKMLTYFKLTPHVCHCQKCGHDFYESFSFLSSSKARITKGLEQLIMKFRSSMSITDISKHFGISWRTVKDVEKKSLAKKYAWIPLDKVQGISIDEMHVFHTGKPYQKYITIVRDIETGNVLNVSRGKGVAALKMFSSRIKRQHAHIKYVCMDMSNSYSAWAKAVIPDAAVVYDKFHIIKAMNDRLDHVRRRVMAKLDAEAKKDLKGKKYLLLSNEDELDQHGKEDLIALRAINQDLADAHMMKEDLRRIFNNAADGYDAYCLFRSWCSKAEASEIPELAAMASTIRSHMKGILGYWKLGKATNASMEGFNGKVRWLIKQAFGFRDFKYFRLKIFDLPSTDIRKKL